MNIVKQLLDHKPGLMDIADSQGITALHVAAETGSAEIVDHLLDRNPYLSHRVDSRGQNALHVAALSGHGEAFLKLLTRNPRLIDMRTPKGENVLHFAAQGSDPQVLELTLSLRPKFARWVDLEQNTALHWLGRYSQSRLHRTTGNRVTQKEMESYLEKIWRLSPSALRAENQRSETPLMCSIDRGSEWGTEFFTRKMSWDDIIQDHEAMTKVSFYVETLRRFKSRAHSRRSSVSRRWPRSFSH